MVRNGSLLTTCFPVPRKLTRANRAYATLRNGQRVLVLHGSLPANESRLPVLDTGRLAISVCAGEITIHEGRESQTLVQATALLEVGGYLGAVEVYGPLSYTVVRELQLLIHPGKLSRLEGPSGLRVDYPSLINNDGGRWTTFDQPTVVTIEFDPTKLQSIRLSAIHHSTGYSFDASTKRITIRTPTLRWWSAEWYPHDGPWVLPAETLTETKVAAVGVYAEDPWLPCVERVAKSDTLEIGVWKARDWVQPVGRTMAGRRLAETGARVEELHVRSDRLGESVGVIESTSFRGYVRGPSAPRLSRLI